MENMNKRAAIIPISMIPNFCSSEARFELLANQFYNLANLFSKTKQINKSIDCYCDAFLLRNLSIEESDKEFIDFFRVQFIIYQLGKKHLDVALSEGDMIFDLIKSEWDTIKKEIENSPFRIEESCLLNWFKSIKIDFPWGVEEYEAFELF